MCCIFGFGIYTNYQVISNYFTIDEFDEYLTKYNLNCHSGNELDVFITDSFIEVNKKETCKEIDVKNMKESKKIKKLSEILNVEAKIHMIWCKNN